MSERLVVIGNGMAGARLVEEILDRAGGERFAITVIGAEPHGNYNRILLPKVLAGTQSAREIVLNPRDWYERNGVTLITGAPVVRIDRKARSVTTADGAELPYDKLIVATGSRAAMPAVNGIHDRYEALKPGIFGFRTLGDCEGMVAWARHARRVAVVGGGLLGLEAGRALLERGLEVDVVQRGGRLMNLQLDGNAADILRHKAEAMGMGVHVDARVEGVVGKDRPEALALADGRLLACDMVVFATGIAPNVELAVDAGLPVARGIAVDDGMGVLGCEDVYSVGECAEHRGTMYGLVAPLWEQVAVLADRLTAADPAARYRGSRNATKLKVSGVELATMGVVEPDGAHDEVVRFSEPTRGIYKAAIVRDGRLVGAILLGDIRRAPHLTQALDQGTVLPEDRAALLFDLASGVPAPTVDDLPEQALVCNCNGVSKADISACVAAGERTLAAVAAQTRATTGCGGCKADVVDVMAWAARTAEAA